MREYDKRKIGDAVIMGNIEKKDKSADNMSAKELLQKLKEDLSIPANLSEEERNAPVLRKSYKLTRHKKPAAVSEKNTKTENNPTDEIAELEKELLEKQQEILKAENAKAEAEQALKALKEKKKQAELDATAAIKENAVNEAASGEVPSEEETPEEIERKNKEILEKLGISVTPKKTGVNSDTVAENSDFAQDGETPSLGKFTTDASLNDAGHPSVGTFDKTDYELMLALGLEDELAKTVNIDAVDVDKIKEEFENKEEYEYFEQPSTTFSGDKLRLIEDEYDSASQNKEILGRYRKIKKSLLLRLCAAALLFLVTLFYENSSFFGFSLPEFINPNAYAVVHVLVDLQLLLLAVALMFREFIYGAKCLFRRKPVPESVTVVLCLAAIAYAVVSCVRGPLSGIKMYNLPVMLCILLNILYRMIQFCRELYSFKVISSRKLKLSVNRMDDEESLPERTAFEEYLEEDPAIFKVNRAEFIEHFYERVYGESDSVCKVGVALIFSVLFAALAYGLGIYMTHNGYQSLTDAYITLMMIAPVSVFVAYGYPVYQASKEAFRNDSAIIGDQSIHEYSDVSVISVDDKDVFQPCGVKVRSVKVYGNNRIDYIIYNVASVFAKLGGPLADVLDIATLDLGHSDDVTLSNIEEDGIEAVVNGKTVFVGRGAFMERNNFHTVEDADDRQIESTRELSIMYIAYDGALAAKMYVQYEADADFIYMLRRLYRQGMCVGVRSFDPNIDNELLSRIVDMEEYPIKIIKLLDENQVPAVHSRIESGIVSRGTTKSLLKTLYLGSKMLLSIRANRVIRILSVIVSALFMAVAVFANVLGNYSSAYIFLYQFIWMIPMYLVSKLYLN